MTSELFLHWLHHFAADVPQRPLLLLCDGHNSHVNLDVIRAAQQHGITMLKFPSHTTHVLQPLDVSGFMSLKTLWDDQVGTYQLQHGFGAISKRKLADLLSGIWNTALTESNVKAGFRHAGIFPLNRDKYPVSKFQPAKLAAYRSEKQVTATIISRSPTLPLSSRIALPQAEDIPAAASSGVVPPAIAMATSSCQTVPSITCMTSTSSTSLNDFFMTQFHHRSRQQSEQVQKRRRIQREAAIITEAEFVEAIAELDRAKDIKKAGRKRRGRPKRPRSPSSSASSNTSYAQSACGKKNKAGHQRPKRKMYAHSTASKDSIPVPPPLRDRLPKGMCPSPGLSSVSKDEIEDTESECPLPLPLKQRMEMAKMGTRCGRTRSIPSRYLE